MTRATGPTRRRRRATLLLTTGLLAALLPFLVGAAPAQAAACTSETHSGDAITGHTGCDDVTPPETTITLVEPTPTVFGYTRSKDLTFTFTGAHTDGDTGTIAFECQLYDTASPPTGWEACTSPQAYTGLADTAANPWTFRVRAIDVQDQAIAACDGSPELFDVLCAGEEQVLDLDATPATTTVRIDTTAPNTFLDRQPVDGLRPDWPVVGTPSPVLELNSNEPAGFACTLNGRSFTPCTKGIVELTTLKGGSYTFLARAYDQALNIDPTPVGTVFYVPSNITKNKKSGWKRVREAGLFGNDYLTSSRVGQTVVLPSVRKVREVRLLAPTGPRYGKVEVRIGTSQWYTVDLASKKNVRLAQLLVRDEFALPRTGPIQIRVKALDARHPSVRIDAIVARGSCNVCGD
jgi:hypothetical protein